MHSTRNLLFSVVFLFAVAVQIRPTSSSSLREAVTQRAFRGREAAVEYVEESGELQDGAQGGEFADASNELDVPALMNHVSVIEQVTANEAFAVQAQQTAMINLEQEQELLAARLAALGPPRVITEKARDISSIANYGNYGRWSRPQHEQDLLSARLAALGAPIVDSEKTGDMKVDSEKTVDEPSEAEKAVEEAEETKHLTCSSKTNRTCPEQTQLSKLGITDGGCEIFGKASCVAGACACKGDVCADGHGKCLSSKKARVLPDTYKIEPREFLDHYLHMQKDDNALDFNKGEPGNSGTWHIIVNNDDTVMLYTKEWGPDYFMSVHYGAKGAESGLVDETPENVWVKFDSPYRAAFEVYQEGGQRQLIYLKDVYSGLWLHAYRKLGGNSIKGEKKKPDASEAFIFHPMLKGIKLLTGAANRVWPLLPLLLLVVSAFG